MSTRHKVLAGSTKRAPRIICYDLETAPNIVTAHSLFNDRGLPTAAIQREKYIICGAWKVVGGGDVSGAIVNAKRPHDDKSVVKTLHAVLSSADAVVAHYGDKFDMRTFNARAIYHGLDPLPPVTQIDTYKIAKARFKFNANLLDYLGEYLGVGRKIKTSSALWDGCMKGSPRALAAMLRYNKQDVRLLERVFLRLYPYTRSRINAGIVASGDTAAAHAYCAHCGSSNMRSEGFQIMRTRFHEFFKCGDCGAWRTGPAVKPEAARKRAKK